MTWLGRLGWPATVAIALGWVGLVCLLPLGMAFWSLSRIPAGGSGGFAIIGAGGSMGYVLLVMLPPLALLAARWFAPRRPAKS